MSEKSKSKPNAQDQLERIVQLNKIIGLDSCLLIYSYLLLFGRTTPAKLREVTGLSKATIFRNLALLFDAEIIEKEDVKTTSDKRYSLHYYIARDLMKEASELSLKPVMYYVKQEGKMDIIAEWGSALETLPIALGRHSSRFIMQIAQTPTDKAQDDCLVISKFLSIRVDEVDDLSALFFHLHDAINRFDEMKSSKKRNMKKPLRRPVVMSISLTAAGPDQPELPKGVVAFVRSCDSDLDS
ncbi:MAG: transcriptional regulator [Candidatus Thorarchaeota archaeon]|nr:MAG: transcriptional regulator [Candidatus Thorarchaeota archaeon]